MPADEKKMIEEIVKAIDSRLTLHHRNNGYATKGELNAKVEVLQRGMDSVATLVGEVKRGVERQEKTTGKLERVVNELKTGLDVHLGQHQQEEKIRQANVAEGSLRVKGRGNLIAVTGLALTMAAMLAAAVLWVSGLRSDIQRLTTNMAPPHLEAEGSGR